MSYNCWKWPIENSGQTLSCRASGWEQSWACAQHSWKGLGAHLLGTWVTSLSCSTFLPTPGLSHLFHLSTVPLPFSLYSPVYKVFCFAGGFVTLHTPFYSRYCSVALAGFLDLVQGSLCPSRVLHRNPPKHQSVQHTILILSCGSHLESPSTSSPLMMSDSSLHCCFPTLWEIFLSHSHWLAFSCTWSSAQSWFTFRNLKCPGTPSACSFILPLGCRGPCKPLSSLHWACVSSLTQPIPTLPQD